MSPISNIGVSALLVGLVLAACATTPERDAIAEAQALRNAEISARRGEAVSRICPRSGDGWKALGDDILLLEARGEWYMAELSGTCDPDSAFASIVTRNRSGTSCLARGDDIFIGRPRSGGRCVITALYAWDEDAKVPTAPDED